MENHLAISSNPKFNNGRWVNGVFGGSDIQFSSGGWGNYYPGYEKDLVSGYNNTNLEASKKKEMSTIRDDETKRDVNKVGSGNHQDDEMREETSSSNAETTNAGNVSTLSAATSTVVAVESTVQDTAERLLNIKL
jgi:squalene cyclase